MTRLYEARLRPHGLRATQFSVLAALALKGPTPQWELAELLGLERTTLTRVAAVLTRKGLLGSARPSDGRERRLEVTAAGLDSLARALPAWRAAQAEAERRLQTGAWRVLALQPSAAGDRPATAAAELRN
ncbi:MAG TPA: MarR family transcriptional regulator [Dehalococcoidia bacterium]|nr:MarR family transcriptional regulator [Dehalococcoidia bacterium]